MAARELQQSALNASTSEGLGSSSGAGGTTMDQKIATSQPRMAGPPVDGDASASSASAPSAQRYDLVVAVAAVSVVIIVTLLFVMRRNNRRTQQRRDVYKSSSEGDDAAHASGPRASVSSMSSTWRATSSDHTRTRTQPRRSSLASPTSTGSTADIVSTSSSDTATLNAIWRDPAVAAARVPFEEIRMRSLLCRGAFGEVFDGSFRGQRVAIKRLLPETRQNLESLEYFMLEVRMMASLSHVRVVTFLGVAWDAMKDLCIVTELMAHGDLRKVLQKWTQRGEPVGWRDPRKLRIAVHVAEALTYLHSLSPKLIIHRDLKSRNVLVDERWDAKLSDFGVSRESSSQVTRTLTANIGSSLWMAPEIMLGENYNESADVFSFGVVLTELDTHALPYQSVATPDGRRLPEPAILHMVTMGSVQAEFSPESRADVVALGRRCLSLDPTVRPSARELVDQLQAMLAQCEAERADSRV